MRKVKHTVTPQVYKEIKKLVQALPAVPKLDKHGKPVFMVHSERVKGKDIPMGTKVNGQDPDPDKYYRVSMPRVRPQNHEVALVSAWEQFGQSGIEAYCKSVADFMERVKNNKK